MFVYVPSLTISVARSPSHRNGTKSRRHKTTQSHSPALGSKPLRRPASQISSGYNYLLCSHTGTAYLYGTSSLTYHIYWHVIRFDSKRTCDKIKNIFIEFVQERRRVPDVWLPQLWKCKHDLFRTRSRRRSAGRVLYGTPFASSHRTNK